MNDLVCATITGSRHIVSSEVMNLLAAQKRPLAATLVQESLSNLPKCRRITPTITRKRVKVYMEQLIKQIEKQHDQLFK